MKVLIADDDTYNRKLLTDVLTLNGCQVFVAETGKQAIDVAKQEKPDFILMDHTMPEMLGYDAAREIRKDSSMQAVPIVMITGDFEVQAQAEDDKMENCAFLPKPYSIEQLMTTISLATGKPFPS